MTGSADDRTLEVRIALPLDATAFVVVAGAIALAVPHATVSGDGHSAVLLLPEAELEEASERLDLLRRYAQEELA